jgi:acetyl esterase/lipase
LRELALASGCLIVAPECRLAPEHPFPAALEDGLAVARWLNAGVAGLGASPEPSAVAGDSSGGNLAAIITHELTRGGTPPSSQALIYPLRDEDEHHAKNLRQAGVKIELRRYPGMIHGFFQMTGALEGSRQLYRELGDWMQTHTEQARRANQ